MATSNSKPPKTVLITGCARGLGYELSLLFSKKGWNVLAVVRQQKDAAKLANHSKDVLAQDISASDAKNNIESLIKDNGGKVDLLINNAALKGHHTKIDDLSTDEIAAHLQVSCVGMLNTVKASIQAMTNAETPLILQISSRLGSVTLQSQDQFKHLKTSYAYRIAKAAKNMATQCLREDLADTPIKVVSIHPGEIKTQKSSSDANQTPAEASEKIYQFIQSKNLQENCLYTSDQNTLPW